jgi:hypothetical protein
MRKAALLLPFMILLCGFARAPFDADSVPRARTARQQAIDACRARTDFKTSADAVDCVTTADSDFAHAVRFNDSKILSEYMTGVKSLDADIVAGKLQPADIAKNFQLLQARFFKAMNDEYADYQASMAQDLTSEAVQSHAPPGMGMGMMGSMDGMGN